MTQHTVLLPFTLFVATLSMSFPGAAATFYIDNSGSPTCNNSPSNGSESNPWCTLNYAVGRVTAGDIVYVKNGTYREQVLISGKNGGPNSITFQNYPGHTPILTGAGVHTGRHKIIDCSYIKFIGFAITDIQQGLFVETSDHIFLQRLHIYKVGQEAVHIKNNSSYVTLQDSLIHDTRAWQYNGEGVYIGTSGSSQPSSPPYDNTNNILVKGNTIYNTNDECIEAKEGTYAVTLDGNLVYNCLLDPDITDRSWGSIDVMEREDFYRSNPNHVVKNNVIFTTKTAIGMHTGGAVVNNIIYGQTGSYRGISIDNRDDDNYTRYIYHNTIDLPSSRAVVVSDAAADIRNNIGPGTTGNIATTSSFYVNQAAADYHLASGSAPVNAGADLTSVVPVDRDGRGRSANPPPDLGAYEFAAGSGTDSTPPSTPTSLSATAVSSSVITLAWTASTDSVRVTGYMIYRSAGRPLRRRGEDSDALQRVRQIGTSSTNAYVDSGVSAATQYTYLVAAYDAVGNVSGRSGPARATAPAASGAIAAASCAAADVQAAINNAQNGHTVTVPAGTCTWSSTVTISGKGITLTGAGIDQTIIADGTASDMLSIMANPAHAMTRVTGLTFDANGTAKSGGRGTVTVTGTGGGGQFRFDTFRMLKVRGRGVVVNMNGTQLSGLVDTCTIEAPYNAEAHGVHIEGAGPEDGSQFNYPLKLGTANAIYVENCTFNYAYPNDGALDAYTGARYVFRYNTVNGTTIGHHGADSGDGRGVQGFELYGNNFDSSGHNVSRIYYMRSGVGFVFDNTAVGNFSSGININNYRSCGNYGFWGYCNSTSNWDQNQPGKEGYPCLDQVGHLFTSSRDGPSTIRPLYAWNNVLNGNIVHATAEVIGNSCVRFLTLHMLENRDFYNYTAGFNGTSGLGRGILASRPSTCDALTAYFATDTNTLYQCSSANTWTSYYTPYTYPHPLRGAVAPATLTELSGIVE